MGCPKGTVPWNKGKKLSDEHRRNLSISHKGKRGVYKKRVYRKCKVCKKKMSLRPSDVKKNIRMCSIECRSEWMSKEYSGKNAFRWKGGKTKKSKLLRCSARWRAWREKVFRRDDYTCQECGIKGVEIHPHHIKPLSRHPKLAFEVDNGQTLCVPCHKKTDTWLYKAVYK